MLNWLARYASVVDELDFDGSGQLKESLLDVGCGPHGLACAAPNAQFAGIDVHFSDRVAPGMTALRTEPGSLPFDDAAFDTVVCLDVLEHVPSRDRSEFVRELARIAAGRVLVAFPSQKSAQVEEFLKLEFSVRGMQLPAWLNEHDEHGLPSEDEARTFCGGVPGFATRDFPMTNGLMATLAALADLLPELTPESTSEFRERPEEWLTLFRQARFGPARRLGYVLERQPALTAKVRATDLRGSLWSAVRCPNCGASQLVLEESAITCSMCSHAPPFDQTGAINLTASTRSVEAGKHGG